MPVKPETKFYTKVNRELPKEIYRLKIPAMYSNGLPDFWYSGFKADGWVEYKWLPKLPRAEVDPRRLLTPLQLLWINSRYREGRLVLVIIGSPEGCVILENEVWNCCVPIERFSCSISEVSLILSGKFHDTPKLFRACSPGD